MFLCGEQFVIYYRPFRNEYECMAFINIASIVLIDYEVGMIGSIIWLHSNFQRLRYCLSFAVLMNSCQFAEICGLHFSQSRTFPLNGLCPFFVFFQSILPSVTL